MSDDNLLPVMLAEVEYAAFNGMRGLGTPAVRSSRVQRTPEGVLISCPEDPGNAYLNRLVVRASPALIPEGVRQVDRVGQDSTGANLRILAKVPIGEVHDKMRVTRYAATDAREFLRIVEATGSSPLDEKVVALKSRFYCSSEFRCFVARASGEVEGLATMYVNGNVGWLANAFTFPRARRQGVHGALLDARLADAGELGLREVYTDVIPGAASERNLLRAGFRHVAYYTAEQR